ncbi:MAG: DNA polymerase III subunit epsilon [Gammaproteobacteria bacterium]|nr:MAG: DNA polymerase III subunit epsilon [Gammaproteobacteria bacterium]
MRQIVLDTETTGLNPAEGHRIIEIGCVELVDRRLTGNHFHVYLNPEREIDVGAIEVHGISNEFLADKPLFADVVDDFIEFIRDAELVIHNAPFDVGFLNHELKQLRGEKRGINAFSTVLDTLVMARKKHPGQRNSLDALCKRYGIDNSHRELHGALLDAEILSDVYLLMTGGQTALLLGAEADEQGEEGYAIKRLPEDRLKLKVVRCGEAELEAHNEYLEFLDKQSGEQCLWRKLDS